eukprot:CAMPEP_0179449334 /NCGR_PEP_ID=MMETSP0799-20121207/33315_1 /TAXON_ID=46947 /ORGANISM="Geminigera cryophila, Strain CCMP2564" /LENGTH=244 /DNA_ID=CAMNT_0021242343 /DNA_START=155 /DNA_END=890 /DNA_ORIENTATION=-
MHMDGSCLARERETTHRRMIMSACAICSSHILFGLYVFVCVCVCVYAGVYAGVYLSVDTQTGGMALYFPDQHGGECIVQAGILKVLGNDFFKAGEPSRALEKYNRIPLTIKGLLKKEGGGGMMGMPSNKDEQALTDDERAEVYKLWHTCHINRAMCYIKLSKWDKGVEACSEAINSGSEDVKAYFRRGKCYRHLGEVEKARTDLNHCATRDPSDTNVQKELLEVEKKQKLQDASAKKTYAKMFK